VIIIPTINI